jgi:hypothetical protein
MSASLGGLSASVTRILFLTGFNKELKTKDIQSAFSDFEGVNGGFKIKWRDDTSLLVVFNDATVGMSRFPSWPPVYLMSEISETGVSTHLSLSSCHFSNKHRNSDYPSI